jgi:hypothetical protein
MKANHKFEKMELNEKIEALSNKSTNNDVFILIVADGIVFFPFFFDELKIAKVVRGKNFTFTERKSTEPGTFSDKSICNELKKLRKPWKEGKMLFFVHWNNFLLPIIWTQNPLPTLNKIPPERWKTSKTKKATAIALTVIVTYCVGQTFWSFLPPFSLPFSGVCENLVKATSRATSAVISGIQNVWKKTKGWATQGVKKIGEISTAISFQNASTEEISEEISQETTAMARGIVVLAKTIGSTVGQLSENMTEEKSEPKAATPNLSEEFSATSEDFSTEEVTND